MTSYIVLWKDEEVIFDMRTGKSNFDFLSTAREVIKQNTADKSEFKIYKEVN